MEHETVKTRIAKLMQKSRKAVRLYTSAQPNLSDPRAHLNGLQSREWERLNKELLNQLKRAIDEPSNSKIATILFSVRDFFYFEWRGAESHMHVKQGELVTSATNSDFIKCALLSNELVVSKARMQAAQAVCHEVTTLIKQSKLSIPTIELSHDNVLASEIELPPVPILSPVEDRLPSNVIPLRKVRV